MTFRAAVLAGALLPAMLACGPAENPEFQAELRSSVARVDAYVAANAPDFTPDKAAKFKRTQGLVGAPRERVCSADAIQIYRAFERGGAQQLRSDMDAALARPGRPTWGTCL